MDRRTAKELLHIREWCERCGVIVDCGEDAYRSSPMMQEAGDSLLMKIGEAARRLANLGVPEPQGVRWADAIANRNWLIHQYDRIDRALTWNTLARDIPTLALSLHPAFRAAEKFLAMEGEPG